MGVIQIEDAQRGGARVVIGLAGQSGDGKTYSALQIGFGLAGYDASKVGLLCTENRRGRLYADVLTSDAGEVQRFKIGDFDPPHSPARYVQAIHDFERAGIEVLIIDSVSHEWEGIGGCHDIAETDRKRWAAAKREHRRFMNALLTCDMHVIACIRARPKVEIEGRGSSQTFTDVGVQPVAEKNFTFELTAGLMLSNGGQSQTLIKRPPSGLMPHLGRGAGYLTAADGYAVREWVTGGMPVDPAVERYRNRLRSVTEKGADFVRDAWQKHTPQHIREALGDEFFATIIEAAQAYDAGAETTDTDGADLDAALGG